ncbi:diacylglycerol pyrophosphate phosphatase 1 [Trichomonascus vanleenenianus]|uniref:bifunctional diacylglycerol diphosphate phosphatase/phosphatidate phosphatase n=1 Tax=Trichomonascus vanleenenianus TaxID=2268995 RepID=UPI003ECAE562
MEPDTPSSATLRTQNLSKFSRQWTRSRGVDWLLVAVVGLLYLTLESLTPFHRLFRLDDPSIQLPYTEHEAVPNGFCIVLAVVLPALVVVVLPLVMNRRKNRLYLIQMSLLTLAATFVIEGLFVNCLKLWLGRHRPDFLARCIPAKNTPVNVYVSIEVCTTTDLDRLYEGFKSTPSGHSANSFAGLVFLSLWLCGQLQACRPGAEHYKAVLSCTPLLLAFYIAVSRTSDYRHHYFDVLFGATIGTTIAILVYRKYFPSVTSSKCYAPHPASVSTDSSYEDPFTQYADLA